MGTPKGNAAVFDLLARGEQLYAYAAESLEKLDALVTAKGRLLDVGCGDGTIAAALNADHVVGFDVSPRCLALAANRGVPGVVADALRGFPLRKDSFDTVYCVDVLHHLGQQWDAVFSEIDRVLRPGGTLVIVEPDARNPCVRLLQSPDSPIRVAPCDDEPAIDPAELLPHLDTGGYTCRCEPIQIEGKQLVRDLFPLWKRLLRAPFVVALSWWYRDTPNKFVIVAQKEDSSS